MAIRDQIKRAAKYGVMGINFVFFVLGLVIIILGAAGVSMASGGGDSRTSELVQSLNISMLASMILMSGCVTLVASIVGFVAAWKDIRVALIVYVVILLIICCIQLAMGSYLMDLDVASLQDLWDDETNVGEARRNQVMTFLNCCGWNTIFEYQLTPVCSVDQLIASPTPLTCRAATELFLEDNFGPLAAAAVAIGVIELLALVGSMVLVFSSKEARDDVQNAFHF